MSQNSPPTELLTSRLLLRAARTEHSTSIFREYTGNDQASRFLPRGPHPSVSRTEAVIGAWGETNWAENQRFVWSIIERRSHTPMGLFLMFLENKGAEIHYGLGPAFWGKGFATEAGLAVMAWIRGESNLSHVHTTCATAHDESRRVLEKIGLVCERPAPEALTMKATGEKLDGMFYTWRRSE